MLPNSGQFLLFLPKCDLIFSTFWIFPGYVIVIRFNRGSLERSLNCPFSDVFCLALKKFLGVARLCYYH